MAHFCQTEHTTSLFVSRGLNWFFILFGSKYLVVFDWSSFKYLTKNVSDELIRSKNVYFSIFAFSAAVWSLSNKLRGLDFISSYDEMHRSYFRLSEIQTHDQCDQNGQFFALWATIQSRWQQLFYPNCPHCKAIFVKVSKSFISLVTSFLGNFYRNLAIFIWSHCSWSSRSWTELFITTSENTHVRLG